MPQPNIEYKNETTSKIILKSATGLSWLQHPYSFLKTGDSQCRDSKHVIGNHVGIVIELCTGITIFCYVLLTFVFCFQYNFYLSAKSEILCNNITYLQISKFNIKCYPPCMVYLKEPGQRELDPDMV